MRKIRQNLELLAALALATFVPGAHGQLFSKPAIPPGTTIPTMQPPQPGFLFPARQTLTYAVDWRVFAAGTATFHLEQQGDVEKVTAAADSSGAVNLLFPVIDKFSSGFNIHTGCSTGFSKQLQEGRRKINSDLKFDYTRGKQEQVEKNVVKGTQKTQEANIPPCVTDSLSGIFYAAAQPFIIGKHIDFPLADSMRTVTVFMKVEGREQIKTPAGTFQTIRVQPTADEGIVKNRGNIWIWYTDDARHIPVQIRARLTALDINFTFRLQSIEAK